MRITGVVRGNVRFPDHPDHEGYLGLVGGEDVNATRGTFRSPGEAMTWCRRVLDGKINPKWTAHGRLLDPYNGPWWSEAHVTVESGDDSITWAAEPNRDRTWRLLLDTRYGDVVRTDPEDI